MKLSDATVGAPVYLREEGKVFQGKITEIRAESAVHIVWDDGQHGWVYGRNDHGLADISLTPLNPLYTKEITVSVKLSIEHDGTLTEAYLEKISAQAEERYRRQWHTACHDALVAAHAEAGYDTLMARIKKWEAK